MRSPPALRLRAQVLELLRLPVDRPAAKLRAAAMRVAERSINDFNRTSEWKPPSPRGS